MVYVTKENVFSKKHKKKNKEKAKKFFCDYLKDSLKVCMTDYLNLELNALDNNK